jgi:hypothetical protein
MDFLVIFTKLLCWLPLLKDKTSVLSKNAAMEGRVRGTAIRNAVNSRTFSPPQMVGVGG